MNPDAEQDETTAAGQERTAAEQSAAVTVVPAKAEAKRRTGVPVWRTGKPDAYLAAAVDAARSAVEGITAASDVGAHLGARSEGDRLVTHLFESKLPGYQGWQWFAVLTRNSRSKVVTVNELGLLPSEDSILAPEWVPWAERVRPEDAQDVEEPEAGAADAGVIPGTEGDAPFEEAAGEEEQDADEQASEEQDSEEPLEAEESDGGKPVSAAD